MRGFCVGMRDARQAEVTGEQRPRAVALGRLLPLALAVLFLVASTVAAAQASTARPWMNRAQPPEQRAQELLAQMTLQEKVDLMTGDQGDAPFAYYNAPIPRLGIPALKMADATSGIGPRGWTLPGTGMASTAMPAPQALASTFDLDMARRYARVVTSEVLETGQNVLLGPQTDVVRLPWWGRIGETFGEDPIQNSLFGTTYTQTVQARHVIASMKHYVGLTQETQRFSGNQNTIIDERTLREVYTLPFEDVVARAGLGSVMCSFNKLNGTYSCENADTLRGILKEQIGFSGFVLTDFGAIHTTVGALQGGTDMETGTQTVYDGALLADIQAGIAPLPLVDEACLRILTTMFRLGIFDRSYTPSSIPVTRHATVARRVEEQAITLLKNDGGALPLTRAVHSVAVIGADADVVPQPSGAPFVLPTHTTSVLQGIIARANPNASVTWVRGNDPVNAANMLESPDMTAVPSSVLSPGASGTGLNAFYWTNDSFQGPPSTTRTDPQVKFDIGFLSTFGLWAGQTSQYPNPPGDAQSAVWTGNVTAPASGTYTFRLSGWGTATLELNGQTASMNTVAGDVSNVDLTTTLTAGQSYSVRITYRANAPLNTLELGTLLLQWSTPAGTVSPGIADAAAAASHADVAIVYVRTFESEQRDRRSLHLPESADQLIAAVSAANPHTVVVLANCGPVTMPWLDSVPAVVEGYYGGQEMGTAVARVLWGNVNPSGRLTVTYPRSETDVIPTLLNPLEHFANTTLVYGEGINVGYKGYLSNGITPLFPFGYGLSYTSFAYSGLNVPATATATAPIHVQFTIANTGARKGAEVGQVYVRLPRRTGEPPRLVGWAKLTIARGGTAVADVTIDPTAPTHPLSWFNPVQHRWVTSPGTYQVFVGPSATNTPLTGSFTLS